MELVRKKKGESRLSSAAFIIALVSLAHLNFFLLTQKTLSGFSLFYMLLPFISLILFISSFFKRGHSRVFGWWAIVIYVFIYICLVFVFITAFSIYPKP